MTPSRNKSIRRRRCYGCAALMVSLTVAPMGYTVAGGWATTWVITPSLVHMVLGLAWLVTTDRQRHHEARWVRQILNDTARQHASSRIRVRSDTFDVVVEQLDVTTSDDRMTAGVVGGR